MSWFTSTTTVIGGDAVEDYSSFDLSSLSDNCSADDILAAGLTEEQIEAMKAAKKRNAAQSIRDALARKW